MYSYYYIKHRRKRHCQFLEKPTNVADGGNKEVKDYEWFKIYVSLQSLLGFLLWGPANGGLFGMFVASDEDNFIFMHKKREEKLGDWPLILAMLD